MYFTMFLHPSQQTLHTSTSGSAVGLLFDQMVWEENLFSLMRDNFYFGLPHVCDEMKL